MFPMRQSLHFRLQLQQGMSVQDIKELAQDTRYAVMSPLYTQSSLLDSNLASGKEHIIKKFSFDKETL
jgi:hypothetical protein